MAVAADNIIEWFEWRQKFLKELRRCKTEGLSVNVDRVLETIPASMADGAFVMEVKQAVETYMGLVKAPVQVRVGRTTNKQRAKRGKKLAKYKERMVVYKIESGW